MITYRYRGHSMSDPAKYRSKEEVQKMRSRARPDRAGKSTCGQRQEIRSKIERGLASEADFARSGLNRIRQLWTDV